MSQYNTCSMCASSTTNSDRFLCLATHRFFLREKTHITTGSFPHLNCPLPIFAHGFRSPGSKKDRRRWCDQNGRTQRWIFGEVDVFFATQRWTKVAQVVGGSKCLPFFGKWGMGVETKYIKYMWIKPPTWDFGVSLAANLNMSTCQKRWRGWFCQVHSSQCSGLCPRHWNSCLNGESSPRCLN